MKIALVHELLTMRGGAERVLKILADMFPDAPIYTLLYNEKKLGDWFSRERVRRSSISPILGYNHHLYLKKFPSAVEAWDFSEFDLVLSTSSAFVHGIITNSAPKHLCYVHSPARYLWDRTHDVQRDAGRQPQAARHQCRVEALPRRARDAGGHRARRHPRQRHGQRHQAAQQGVAHIGALWRRARPGGGVVTTHEQLAAMSTESLLLWRRQWQDALRKRTASDAQKMTWRRFIADAETVLRERGVTP
jgi:hypothetical protein